MHALTSYVSITGYFNSLMAHLTLFNSDHGPSDYLTHDLINITLINYSHDQQSMKKLLTVVTKRQISL